MGTTGLKVPLCIVFLTSNLIACSDKTSSYSTPTDTNAGQSISKTQLISVRDASLEECPAGGKAYSIYQDFNDNGVLDEGESALSTQVICNGQNGLNGQDGADGENGADGQDGTDGQDGETPDYQPLEPIYPCGNTTQYHEVLLRLPDGQVLASFSNNTSGDMTRLVVLPDGNYMNTDGSGCQFSISTSSDGLTRSISWANEVQMSWAIHYN